MSTDDRSRAPTEAVRALWASVDPRLLLLGVLALAGVVYLPTLAFDLVYDDHWVLSANGFLREPNLRLLLSPEGAARNIPDAFRPTSVAFDALSYHWLGLWAPGQHALSVALHVAACVMLSGWLSALRMPLPLRIASVGLFGVLAIHAEAVAVVSYREDLLAAVFGLGAMVLAERSAERDGWHRAAWASAAAMGMAIACGAKMSAAPLAVVFVLARVISPWRPRAWRPALTGAFALALGAAVPLVQRIVVFGSFSPYQGEDPRLLLHSAGMAATMATSVGNQVQMLWQLVMPLTLSPEYVDRPGTWAELAPWLSVGAVAALIAWGIGCAGRFDRKPVALSILGTALLMLPTAGFVALPNLRADRFMYLPSALACIGLAAGALRLGTWLQVAVARRVRSDAPAVVLVALAPLVAFAIVQGGLSQAAAHAYRSDTRLWTIALRRAPHSARAHAVQGELLLRRAASLERSDPWLVTRAGAHCALAARYDRGAALPLLCRARLASLEKDWSRAHRSFSAALPRAIQGRDRVLAALASVALDVPGTPAPAREANALAWIERATREYPYSSEVFAVAGGILHRLGRDQSALDFYRRARELRPERWDLVIAGLELQVDLGHPSAARLTWELYEEGLVQTVDLSRRKAARRRLQDAERLFGAHLP